MWIDDERYSDSGEIKSNEKREGKNKDRKNKERENKCSIKLRGKKHKNWRSYLNVLKNCRKKCRFHSMKLSLIVFGKQLRVKESVFRMET